MWRSFHLQAICSGVARTCFPRDQIKNGRLPDCIRFIVMNGLDINDGLTNDHHFEQAGFRILLKD